MFASIDIGRTFASLRALKPVVVHVSVADAPAILIPSTARSATTNLTRFLERAAILTQYSYRGGA